MKRAKEIKSGLIGLRSDFERMAARSAQVLVDAVRREGDARRTYRVAGGTVTVYAASKKANVGGEPRPRSGDE